MMDTDMPPSQDKSPELWNPRAAIGWSLLLSPAFGAYLHAANWQALNEPQRASENKSWFWVSIVFTILALLTEFLPNPRILDALFRLVGLCLFIAWYRSQARHQVTHFRDVLENCYTKKRWGRALLAGFTPFLVGVVVIMIFAVLEMGKIDPKMVVETLRPELQKQWPEHKSVTIGEISLIPTKENSNKFTGTVEATLDGETSLFPLEINVGKDSELSWIIGEPDDAESG
ncbi:hypothetical protein [Armatimonas sp.]|uniref:hypothetical protein n=1 Tax=Armatimonas sp. TaxID=1872638 RepID=UPI00286CC57A|nr:hypothetical protein [Armatimonas sp.]